VDVMKKLCVIIEKVCFFEGGVNLGAPDFYFHQKKNPSTTRAMEKKKRAR